MAEVKANVIVDEKELEKAKELVQHLERAKELILSLKNIELKP